MSAARTIVQIPYSGDPFAAVIAELRAIREAVEARPGAAQTRQADAPWTIDDAAEHLHVSPRHLRNLARDNKIRSLKLGRRVLLPASEVERLSREGVSA